MASTADYIFLVVVLAIVAGLVYALKPGQEGGRSFKDSQEALKKRGINLSSSGLSVKSDRRAMSQQEYIDKTQKSFANSADRISKHRDAFKFGGGSGDAKKKA
ncbi:uncharacterized protein PFL1_00790 [Pseudozyma flocculosa PF-1]|uniref:Uncharacterized protein n=1 Tax=Pseudozyma flocculosa TaxID=84751 RepID=A0A5C3F356_9BASI|nr:uncharacterized protein PFL1_00790 [Pseudozyma flocculosa PF-1]EPQ31455.1 hypothetical protein PFL1_00790 [Pseudozyma flocculosa PF-1]SPO38762.1 uncharacterized protein PSFLO_04241 [Pseudozyma flocculosa]